MLPSLSLTLAQQSNQQKKRIMNHHLRVTSIKDMLNNIKTPPERVMRIWANEKQLVHVNIIVF